VTTVAWLLASYLLGALPTSHLVGKYIAGVDLRQHGSRNLGATNVYRVLGWPYAVPVALVDIAKGAIPVLMFAPRAGAGAWTPLALGIAAVVGHVYSVFVRFRGGKGVATAAGVVLALEPAAFGLAALAWGVVVALTGYVSLASLTAAVAFPVLVWLIHPARGITIGAASALAAFILFTHRSNIRRLLAGTESRFGRRARAG
jgi:glycerol-3-phosphate acyltransferase PlsY